MVRWIPIVLASCSSLAGYTEVKPQIEDFDEIVDTVEESVIDSDSIWDTGTSGDTSEAKKELETGIFTPHSKDTYSDDTY